MPSEWIALSPKIDDPAIGVDRENVGIKTAVVTVDQCKKINIRTLANVAAANGAEGIDMH